MKKSMDVLLVSALGYEEQHDMGNAIKDFSVVLKTEPNNIFAMSGMARCLLHDFYNKGNLRDGLDIVKKLMDEHKQRSFEIYFLNAKLLWRLRKHSDALRWIGLCESRFGGNNPEMLFTKARILVTCQRLGEAEEIMQDLPSRESNFIQGRIEIENKHFTHAARLFREYIDASSLCDAGAGVVNYLSASVQTKKYDLLSESANIGQKFLDECKDAVRVSFIAYATSNCLWYKAELAKTKEEKEMCWNEIIDIARQLQELQKATWSLVFNKSIVYKKLGNLKEALIALDDSLSLLKKSAKHYDKNYRGTLFERGKTLLEMEEYDDSIRCFKKMLAYKKKHMRKLPKLSKNKTWQAIFSASSSSAFHHIALCYDHLGDEKKFAYWENKADEGMKAQKDLEQKMESRVAEYDSPPSLYTKGIENETEEHKSSFFYHGEDKIEEHRKGKDKEHVEEIAESVCAFLNTDGGTIVIGINDDQECFGIEADIKRTSKGTQDAYMQEVRTNVENMLVERYPGMIHYHFRDYYPEALGSKKISLFDIIVDKLPSSELIPAMMIRGQKQYVYFRHGESDQPYPPNEAMKHMKRRAEKNRDSY